MNDIKDSARVGAITKASHRLSGMDEFHGVVHLSPMDVYALQAAVAAELTEFVGEHHTFNIRYDAPRKRIFYSPSDGALTPCGWVPIERLMRKAD